MKKRLNGVLVVLLVAVAQTAATAQQIPFLSELLSRYEEFNRLYAEKRRAAQSLSAIEPLRKRGEEAFKRGNIPGVLEVISEGQALLAGKKWDERQKFIASLALETDRLVIEPNQVLQMSLTRMFPANIERAFPSAPTVTFIVAPRESGATPPAQPVVVAERLSIAETSSTASRKLLLPDGAYDAVAIIEIGAQKLVEIKRPVYAISDFTDIIAQMSRTVAGIKNSSDAKVKAVAALVATPEFQLQRLAQLNKARGDFELNPNQEIERIESALSAIAKGQNPFAAERGEVERAYQGTDGTLIPYRLYVPKSYDGANPTRAASSKPLVVMLHGAYSDERSFFSGLYEPAVIKGEAERRGWLLAAVNGRSRFALSQEDVLEVIRAATRDYKVDSGRVYLIGHSMGGFASWLIASAKPEMFAGLAAISGGPPVQGDALTTLLSKLKDKPAMIVHGAQDGIVPAQMSRAMAAAAEKVGLRVSYLEVADGDHLSVVASTFPAVLDFFEKNVKPADSPPRH